MLIKNTLNLDKEMNMQTNSLLNLPVNGTFEYNALGLYFTHDSIRQKIHLGYEYTPNVIKSQGRTSSNVFNSPISFSGYQPMLPSGNNSFQNGGYGCTLTDANTITLNSDPSYIVNSLVNTHCRIVSSSATQMLKVKSNTSDTITFYENIIPSGTISLWRSYEANSDSNTNWNFDDTYIDTGFNGKFIDAIFDGVYMWMLPNGTSGLIYKVNTINKIVETISYGVTSGLQTSLVSYSKFIYVIINGADCIQINTETNALQTITNTLQNPATIIVNSTLFLFGTDPNASNVNTYSILNFPSTAFYIPPTGATGMDINHKVKHCVASPDKPFIIYLISENNSTQSIGIWEIDLSGASYDLALDLSPQTLTTVGYYNSCTFDGTHIYIGIKSPSIFNFYRYNIFSKEAPILILQQGSGTSTHVCGNIVFTGELLLNIFATNTNNGVSSFFTIMNASRSESLYGRSTIYVSKLSVDDIQLLCSDNLIFQWGGRYICKDYLPNSKKQAFASDSFSTIFENGIKHKWKTITANYTIDKKDYGLLINTSTAKTITLPTASTVSYQEFIFKDDTGSAATNNITISGSIEGAGSATISTNYGTLKLVSNGTSYRII